MNDGIIVAFFDDHRIFDFIVEFGNFALVCRLLVARRVVFRIFGKIAVASCFGNAFYDLRAFGRLKIFEALDRFLISFLRHIKLICHI